ncbi:MAG: MbtH family protein [Myxococcota bacterium]
MSFDSEETTFRVVINHEEQYSIWPDYLEIPNGWREVGKVGKKAECLAYINEHWTDMRPLSLRKQMEAQAAQARAIESSVSEGEAASGAE